MFSAWTNVHFLPENYYDMIIFVLFPSSCITALLRHEYFCIVSNFRQFLTGSRSRKSSNRSWSFFTWMGIVRWALQERNTFKKTIHSPSIRVHPRSKPLFHSATLPRPSSPGWSCRYRAVENTPDWSGGKKSALWNGSPRSTGFPLIWSTKVFAANIWQIYPSECMKAYMLLKGLWCSIKALYNIHPIPLDSQA